MRNEKNNYDRVDTESVGDIEQQQQQQQIYSNSFFNSLVSFSYLSYFFSSSSSSSPSSSSSICWFYLPNEPWSLSYYTSSKGQENCHIYFWLLKDLAWVQSWYYEGIVIGALACSWSLFLVFKSIQYRNLNEFWSRFADFLWLFANYWWMIGETHDYQFPNGPFIYDKCTKQAAWIMITALIWISLYYILLKPFGLTNKISHLIQNNNNNNQSSNQSSNQNQNESNNHDIHEEASPRFQNYFSTWREYENLHSLFWIGKDAAWVLAKLPMWFIFFFPTVAVSIDVTIITLYKPSSLVDHAHHCAQFLWVIANAVWASGELFLTVHHDEPLSISRFDSESRVTARWYSSWFVIFSFLPLVILYSIWLPATWNGRISSAITSKSLSKLNLSNNSNNNNNNNTESDNDSNSSNNQNINQEFRTLNDQKSITSPHTTFTTITQSPLYIDGDQSSHSIYL